MKSRQMSLQFNYYKIPLLWTELSLFKRRRIGERKELHLHRIRPLGGARIKLLPDFLLWSDLFGLSIKERN